MTQTTSNIEDLLRKIVARSPKVTLDSVRRAHPAFRAMSYDHLLLRIEQIERGQRGIAK
ncbi:hypothetical protein [Phenylobacterium sp.]|uniref:hypothetical protein n=1 Tax=Phenylobacterium sp. TaxID=1871053 RepID=UPI0040363600